MRILIVDDSNSIRYVMTKILRELGYKDVAAIGSAEEAIQLLKTEIFDVVLLDWNMPRVNGYEVLKFIRSNPSTEKIAVVMITTVNEKATILQALKLGIQGYFFKPVQKEMLSSKLAEIASRLSSPTVAS